jgi:hypothetical protein
MPNKVKLKRSYTVGAVPLTTDLDVNEVAVNWADNKLFTKNSAGNIVSITLGGAAAAALAKMHAGAMFKPPPPRASLPRQATHRLSCHGLHRR